MADNSSHNARGFYITFHYSRDVSDGARALSPQPGCCKWLLYVDCLYVAPAGNPAGGPVGGPTGFRRSVFLVSDDLITFITRRAVVTGKNEERVIERKG